MVKFTAQNISYEQTKAFTRIATDYIAGAAALRPFYRHLPDVGGIKDAILERKRFPTDRVLLVQQLKLQYSGATASRQVQANIESLLLENTFTITTAHQPNIFTGHLYFIYKILHTIKLAEEFTRDLPGNNFVPVYYMGSEDADLEELGEVTLNGKKYVWETSQTGAVGRMTIDKMFTDLIDAIAGQLSVEPHGAEIISLVQKVYTIGKTIEKATFELVHELFSGYGLVVLLPDNAALKKAFTPVIQKELKEQFSHKAATLTMDVFPAEYKVQASGREINLFYLQDGSRERIETANGQWLIVNSDVRFNDDSILAELEDHPERFSPNVILRPVFQELILPNIVFIGGGGELAYWLELKKVFEAVDVPYPVLVLRNSFMIVPAKLANKMNALELGPVDFFQPTKDLVAQVVKKNSALQLHLAEERSALSGLYDKINKAAASVDPTLQKHVQALYTGAEKKINDLEKKMLKAEKRKFEAEQRQVEKIKSQLFPNNSLQERVDNMMPYYAVYGKGLLDLLYAHSLGLEQEFCILSETGSD